MPSIRPMVVAWVLLDLIAVCVFAAVGKASHGGDPGELLGAAWPFLGGAGLGWLGAGLLRRRGRGLSAGVLIWAVTVVVGVLLRHVSGDAAPWSFVLVSAVVLGALMLGWRLVAWALARLSPAPRSA